MTRLFPSYRRPGHLAACIAIAFSAWFCPAAYGQAVPPTVSTAAGVLNGSTGFDAGGEVTDEGDAVVTASGLCWNTTGAPTVADGKTVDGAGIGTFTSQITHLSEDTLYYFRAYATSEFGTSYGQLRMIITGNSVTPSAYAWTSTLTNEIWGLAAGSMDHSVLFAGAFGLGVFTSTDGGSSWLPTSLPPDNWYRGAASVDAQIVLAAAQLAGDSPSGRLYLSIDGGANWSEQQLAGDVDTTWDAVAMSADGTHQIAGSLDNDRVFISQNAGASWSELAALAGAVPDTACMSADGYTILVAGQNTDAKVYISRDAGANWTESQPGGAAPGSWQAAVCSSDGQRMYLADVNRVFRSEDGGQNWAECTVSGDTGFANVAMACSADGRQVLWGALGGGLFLSSDAGANWAEIQPGGQANGDWVGISLSTDGTRVLVNGVLRNVYVGRAGVVAPTVTTTGVSSITAITAIGGGDVTADGGGVIRARGVCWNTTGTPTVAEAHTSENATSGAFTSSLTGLSPSTTYYVRAYATNDGGTAYGAEETFTTSAVQPDATTPAVSTADVSGLTSNTAVCGGDVSMDGNDAVTARGVCWNTTGTPTVGDPHTTDGTGTGAFTSSVTGLSAATTYYLRAYATNGIGTAYGNEIIFTTLAPPVGATLPTVTTAGVSNVTWYSAQAGGNVTDEGGRPVTQRGVCWNQSGAPVVVEYHTSDGTGVGAFTSSFTGLIPSTTYHLRAYATNAVGTAYGEEVTFTTAAREGGPALSVTIARTGEGGVVPVGGDADFLLTISNTGDSYAAHVTFTLPLPSGTEFISAHINPEANEAVPMNLTSTAGEVMIRLLTVPPAASIHVVITLRALVAGSFPIDVSVSSTELPAKGMTGAPATLQSEDVYTVVVKRRQLPHLCGLWGIFPWCMTTLGLLLMRGRRWR